MKSTLKYLFIIVVLVLVSSCSKDDVNEHAIVGKWKLTTWTVNIPFDLNHDMVLSTNLLNEIDCANNEILEFNAKDVVASDDTFNPKVDIALLNGTTDRYTVTTECAEGIIGFSKSYTVLNDTKVLINNAIATINGNQLTIVYDHAVSIYNQDFSQVIATKNLTKIYTKL
ncbi:MAG: hypothetical protein KDC68_02880 [Gelidibacter sp.]|nr:hypothetical protein [Gelidibacter sp.]